MYRRATIGLISVLSCCALACVGFSAWSITTDDMFTAPSSGTLTSEDVILSDEYVKIDEDLMKTLNEESFVVSPTGFVHKGQDGEIQINMNGTLQIPLTVDNAKCSQFFSGDIKVDISIALSKGSASLWQTPYISASCKTEGVEVAGAHNGTAGYIISFTIDSTTTKSVVVCLDFNFISLQTYKAQLYDRAGYVTQSGDETKIDDPFVFVVAISDATKS